MARTLFALTALAIAAAPVLAGTQAVTVGAFTEIETRGGMNVVYEQGPGRSVTIETDSDDFSDASVTVRNGKLMIDRESLQKRGLFGNQPRLQVSDDGRRVRVNGREMPVYTVIVTSPALERIKVAQSSSAEVALNAAPRFEASASSGSRIALSGQSDEVSLQASSAGSIDASAFSAGAVKAQASSSGTVDAGASGEGTQNLEASSAGEIRLVSTVPARFALEASSSGQINVSGPCEAIAVSASSGAVVRAGDLTCTTASVETSSGSSVSVSATGSVTTQSSSGSAVTVSGSPSQRDVRRNSGASVSFAD